MIADLLCRWFGHRPSALGNCRERWCMRCWQVVALGLLALLAACSDSATPEPLDARPQQLCTSGQAPPAGSPCPASGPCRILALGDSITVGCKVTPCEPAGVAGAYRIALWQRLVAENRWVDLVGSYANGDPAQLGDREYLAIPGKRIDEIQAMAAPVVRALQPHVVLVHAGSNDISQATPLATMQSRWNNLIFDLHAGAPQALILWAELLPLANMEQDCQAKSFNQWVAGRIAARSAAGWKERYVPMRSDIAHPLDFVDGAHPNAQGYAKMGTHWAEALLPVLP
jgi:acyl-CoA thioesterase-1